MEKKIALLVAILLVMPPLLAWIQSAEAQQTLKIGVLVPYNLVQGEAWRGGAEGGAWLATWDINNATGINIGGTRYKIELVIMDECAYPLNEEQARANTLALIQAGCKIIVGGFRTESTNASIRAVYEWNQDRPDDEKVIYLINGASTDELITNTVGKDYEGWKWLFRINPINSTMLFKNTLGWLIGYLIPKKLAPMYGGLVKYGVLVEDYEWTKKIQGYLSQPGALGPNATCVYSARTPPETVNFDPYLREAANSGSRLLLIFYTLPTTAYLISQWYQGQYPFLICGIDVYAQSREFVEKTGGLCEYEMTEDFAGTRTPITPLAVRFWDNFVGNFSKPGEPPAWPVYTAWGAYNAFLTIKAALETAGELNSTKIIQALESQEIWVLNGKARFTPIHDVYSISYGVLWPDKYTRAVFIQWQKGADGNLYKVVVCPIDQPYSRKTMIPPWIYPLADVDLKIDGIIDVFDAVILAAAAGSYPGHPNWNMEADINRDGIVDIFDAVLLAGKAGQQAPQWPLP